MATADVAFIIDSWPIEGCGYIQACMRMPYFAQATRPDGIMADTVRRRDRFEFNIGTRAMLQQCDEQLRDLVERRLIRAEVHRTPLQKPEPIEPQTIWLMRFDQDRDLAYEPDGTARYAPRFYATAKRPAEPKPEPPELSVTIKGPVVLTQEHRGKNAEIVKAAEEEFPDGWRTVKPKTLVVNSVLNRMGWDSSKRNTVLRALGWRKG
jgi:hypothetical protein